MSAPNQLWCLNNSSLTCIINLHRLQKMYTNAKEPGSRVTKQNINIDPETQLASHNTINLT